MHPETKRMLEPALSKIMEHFTSQIQQLEKRVECAETNVVTEAERVRAELRAEHQQELASQRAEHEMAVAEMRREHAETVDSLGRVQAKQQAEHEKAVAEMRREHAAAVQLLKAGLPGFEQKVRAQMAASVETLNGRCAKAEAGFLARLELLEQQAAATPAGQLVAEMLGRASMPEAEKRLVFLKQRRPHRTAKAEGYSCAEVKLAGYSCEEAREVWYSCKEAREAGYSCEEAREAGYSCMQARGAGYSWEEVREAGYSWEETYRVRPL